MAPLLGSESTTFTLDNMGRFLCNSLQEALDSAGQTVGGRTRAFDTIIVGGGTFGFVVAEHLFWFVAEHLLHRRTEISEPALSIGGKNDLRHVLYQLAVFDLGLTQRLGRLLLAALGKQDSRAGADQ